MAARHTLALAACFAVLAPLPAVGAAPSPAVVTDVAEDANALNDQGEGLVGNRATPGQSAGEADLRELTFAALRTRGRTTGASITFTTQEPFQAHRRTGQALAMGLVAQVDGNCLFSLIVTTSQAGSVDTASLGRGGCTGAGAPVSLPAVQSGSTVRVDVPYELMPPQAQAGTQLRDVRVFTRLAPAQGVHVVEIDGAYGGRGARLPH